jgi:predicted transcriptional regulator
MSIAELKLELIKKINELPENQLKDVHGILSNYLNNNADFWDNLDQKEKESIEAGLKDIEEGNVVPHEEVMKKLKAKLEK